MNVIPVVYMVYFKIARRDAIGRSFSIWRTMDSRSPNEGTKRTIDDSSLSILLYCAMRVQIRIMEALLVYLSTYSADCKITVIENVPILLRFQEYAFSIICDV